MKELQDIELIDGVTFELRPHHRAPTWKKIVCLRKNREFTNRYLELAEEFGGCRMVELGIDQGGSTAFFGKLLKPAKLVAMELTAEPVKALTDFLLHHGLDDSISLHWGVDQADRAAVSAILDEAFDDHPLDFVVDDASHLLTPSTASFEMLFPRLRPGGLFVLEDWSYDHLKELGLHNALQNNADEQLMERFLTAAHSNTEKLYPMSILICQLVVAAARNPDWITEVRARDGFCEVRRGPAEIPRDTPIHEYIGVLGNAIFEAYTD